MLFIVGEADMHSIRSWTLNCFWLCLLKTSDVNLYKYGLMNSWMNGWLHYSCMGRGRDPKMIQFDDDMILQGNESVQKLSLIC